MQKTKLIAFHGKADEKEELLKQLQDHYDQDEIIKGKYWEGGKGCAVGCTIHSDVHKSYETELGIPEWLARLEDVLFEGMDNPDAKEFPLRLIKAIPTGFSNWNHIYHQLCVHILEKECKNTDHKTVSKAIDDIIKLHRQESEDKKLWYAAARLAGSAAGSAQLASWSAESAAESAAMSAAMSAESAAMSAESAARSAESAARSAESVERPEVLTVVYKSIADKLIELLEK